MMFDEMGQRWMFRTVTRMEETGAECIRTMSVMNVSDDDRQESFRGRFSPAQGIDKATPAGSFKRY